MCHPLPPPKKTLGVGKYEKKKEIYFSRVYNKIGIYSHMVIIIDKTHVYENSPFFLKGY